MGELGLDACDFGCGTWECTLEGGHDVTTITRESGDHITIERFSIDEPNAWNGMSVSVDDPIARRWPQTCVDDDANSWHVVGTTGDGTPSLETSGPIDPEQLHEPMLFTDVSADSFEWRWESSTDQETWTENWAISSGRRA